MTGRTIVVLGTGGTIAGSAATAADHLGYQAAQLRVEHLLQVLPTSSERALVVEQVAQIDSKDMTMTVLRQLALRCAYWLSRPQVRGIVVTHGTDTVEETAFFLQTVLAPDKPVVLTCAMRPATALTPDGPQNLADALTVAEMDDACGVTLVCAGTIHGPHEVTKVHPYRLDAFNSGDAGPIGQVQAGQVRRSRDWPRTDAARARAFVHQLQQDGAVWPNVQIVLSHAGVDGTVVDALVAAGVAGLVVAATGNGTVHRDLEAALERARFKGVRVLRSTRCALGQVLPHAGEQFAPSPLSPVKARIALMLELLAA